MSAREIVRLMSGEDARVVRAVEGQLAAVARAVDGLVERLRRGGRWTYLGAGTSGRLGVLDAAECPPTFGTEPSLVVGLVAGGPDALMRSQEAAEDDEAAAVRSLEARGVDADDAVVGISAGGTTPYTLAGVRHARSRGAFTVGLSCNESSPLARAAEVAITPVVGPEVLTGSTRLKAGSATKMVLNMLSTATMILLGHTRDNLMTGLQPACDKLQERAARIVAQLTGVTHEEAFTLLERAGGEVHRAVELHGSAGPRQ